MLATGDFFGKVSCWDVKTRAPTKHDPIHMGINSVRSLAFSPDHNTLFCLGSDKVSLWDMKTRVTKTQPLRKPGNWLSRVLSVAISRNGKLIASGGRSKDIVLWDVQTGQKCHAICPGQGVSRNMVAIAPDGELLVSGGDDKIVRLWNCKTGKPEAGSLEGHQGEIKVLAFGSNYRLASGDDVGEIRLWNYKTGQQIGTSLLFNQGDVTTLTFYPKSDLLVSGNQNGAIYIWDLGRGAVVGGPLQGHKYEVTGLIFNPSGDVLASSGGDGTIRLWDMHSRYLYETPLRQVLPTSIAFNEDGRLLVSGGNDKTVRVWDVSNPESPDLIALYECGFEVKSVWWDAKDPHHLMAADVTPTQIPRVHDLRLEGI